MEQGGLQLGSIAFQNIQINVGKTAAVGGEHMGENHPSPGMGKTDGELADGKILDVRQLVIGLVFIGQKGPCPHKKALAGVGQSQGRSPVEEGDAEFLLYVGDMVA